MSHWRTRFIMVAVLVVGAISLLCSTPPALADAPGTTAGANNCPDPNLPCILDAYQDEVNIEIYFLRFPPNIGYDKYNLRWAVFGDWNHASQVEVTADAYEMFNAPWPATYTFIVQGCRNHLFGSNCGPWSNPVTLYTTTPAISQRGVLNPLTAITETPDQDGFYQDYNNGVSVYCRNVPIWYDPAKQHRSQRENAYLVYGLIRSEWAALGWERSILGYPITDESWAADGVGRCNNFQWGAIYWSPATGTGAHEVHKDIWNKWLSLGGVLSGLKYPVIDQRTTPDGNGQYSQFQGGMIYWTPSTLAHEIHGGIPGTWASMGYERSWLGYPLSDETRLYPSYRGAFSQFQNGCIYWFDTAYGGRGIVVTPGACSPNSY